MKVCFIMLLVISLVGCVAGKIDYVQPKMMNAVTNSKIINKPRDLIWNSAIPEIGKQFFVINNIDKASGIINLSYTGKPEGFIDCGIINSYVKNARGERSYVFAGESSHKDYEVMNERGLFFVTRKISLEGRINLIFEESGTTETKITANTRYVITRNITARSLIDNIPQSSNHTISFNSGGSADFPQATDGRATRCVSTGEMEKQLLDLIK